MIVADPSLIAALFGKLGIAAVVVLIYRMIRHSTLRPGWSGLATGLAFAVGAVASMINPLEISPGIIIDARNVMVALATVFGGFWAGLLSAVIVTIARILIGGAGVETAVLSIMISLAAGLVYRLLKGPQHNLIGLGLLGLSLSVTFVTPFPFLPAATVLPLLQSTWLAITVSNVAGAVIMGGVLAAEDRIEDSYGELRMAAMTDPLTGLKNRRQLDRLVNSWHAGSFETDTVFAVMLIDVDHFKAVNDSYGHPLGDDVLREIAGIVSRRVRRSDLAVRFGGDEIVIIMPDCPSRRGLAVAEGIREKVAQTAFNAEGELFSVTVSIGVAAHPATPAGLSRLIDTADRALYRAKAEGRNRSFLLEEA
ncbi:diguanylate cyclase [Martelella alba]|uniref:diguanylate cyclase n=1 Tax=Martelella alba TaxID=2590451 RepID=A0A506U5P7_9HYPH|nr:diguanylate cyclase [Martelella alba]TPW29170.1 diguanylate cyclase [Martelella alba]